MVRQRGVGGRGRPLPGTVLGLGLHLQALQLHLIIVPTVLSSDVSQLLLSPLLLQRSLILVVGVGDTSNWNLIPLGLLSFFD